MKSLIKMKFTVLFLIFSTCLLLSSTSSDHLLQKIQNGSENLPRFVCNITNSHTSIETPTQDILIGNLGGNISPQMVNDITRCIDDEKAVVITDFKGIIKEQKL